MSLVPIIYTSLLIFSAVLFIVIVVSYASFKAKSSRAMRPSERLKHESMQGNNIYVGNVPRVQLSPSPTLMVLPQVSNGQTSIQKNRYTERSEQVSRYQQNLQSREEILRQSREMYERNRSKAASMRNRLEIMNTSEISQPKKQQKNNPGRNIKSTHDMSDYGLLNFYFDGKDKQLSRATTVEFRQAL